MCTEGGGGRKRGEAGARQGSRMGVLIKKTQIAAQQMISFFPDIRLWWVETRVLEIFVSHGTELILVMQVQEGKAQVVIISIAASQ